MMISVVALLLSTRAIPAIGREPLRPVPFVGCPSGGQLGLQPAPKSGRPRWIKGAIAAKLAFYSDGDAGVFAPRGWHCAAVSGSSGAGLIVVPDKRTSERFRRLDNVPIRGSFVWAGTSFGGTSGRGNVVRAIARYFPSYRDFIRKVREMDLLFERLPNGPYPHDVLRERSKDYVRFTTPPGRTGEGANSLIAPNAQSVEGFRKLVGPRDEPDLRGVDVRLPARDAALTRAILSNSQ